MLKGNLRRSLEWLGANRDAFSFHHGRTAADRVLLLKPFSEFVLAIDLIADLAPGTIAPDDHLNWAWAQLSQGDALLHLLVARPDTIEVAGLCANLARRGLHNTRLEQLLEYLSKARMTTALELPLWRVVAMRYNFWRLGITEFPSDLLKNAWFAVMPEPWTISDAAAYTVTHNLFYATDFGRRAALFGEDVLAYLRLWLPVWSDLFVKAGNWDLAMELAMSMLCIGETVPARRILQASAHMQRDDGSYPGPYGAGRQLRQADDTEERTAFLNDYHTSLVGALGMAMLLAGE